MAVAKLALVAAVALLALLPAAAYYEAVPTVVAAGETTTSHTEGQYHLERARGYGQGSLKPYQCSPECSRRCGRTQYRKPCLFFCNKCCNKCLCVPPGNYGNKGVCPCYNNWKTKRGGPKCP